MDWRKRSRRSGSPWQCGGKPPRPCSPTIHSRPAPEWLSMVVGIVAGTMLITGAIYVAARVYLRHNLMPGARKPRMPDNNGRTDIPDSGIDGHGECF